MKIYTKRGDRGETDLFGGERVGKDHHRVEAYGEVDELNSVLGMAAAASSQDDIVELAQRIQGTLFDLGAYLASPDAERRAKSRVPEPRAEDVEVLEKQIDAFESELEPLRRFILPGGTAAAAAFHVARAVCRRAERRAVSLDRAETLDPLALRFLNRLSDLLFVLARVENHRAEVPDVEWESRS
ncbi:MAG: cob(I)yrinic acid a,c-diamide adenosyltransferase [Deltaproteobacteria bacterium]|nr:cob(I)yrinic acid a,c-diamide adenosyltransferase [Deltaproteobacteria bacterium]MBW2393638.1 cob(I)yrinic acid a,c-diamide adenosyltransferase [Deltaproteobacteria bacterium]